MKGGIDGINSAPQPTGVPYDMHCPLMGSRNFNYWKSSCEERQGKKEHSATCTKDFKCKGIAATIREFSGGCGGNSCRGVQTTTAKKRYEIIGALLRGGYTSREIENELDISGSTVSRGKKHCLAA